MLNISLNTPVSDLTRVGKTTAGRLKKLGIETVNDLIFYYPYRWQDFSQVYQIGRLQPQDAATVRGKIQLIGNRRSFKTRKILTEAIIADDSGSVKAIWFNQPYLTKMLQPGDEVYLSGKVDYDKYTLQFVNPVYEKASNDPTHTARIIPLYSLTSNLTQKQIRFLIKTALPAIGLIGEPLPPAIIAANGLLDYQTALRQVHFPESDQILQTAIKRLKFDELFYFQLQVQLSKRELDASQAEPVIFAESETKEFVSQLPFKLTGSQRQAAWQIISDLGRNRPTNRLLEGDVGSGKTVVAALAILNAALGGKQSALIAPTEILAAQHYRSLRQLFRNRPFKLALLTRGQRLAGSEKISKSPLEKMIAAGDIDIVVGTHALIQEGIGFHNLALAVIDEQHRFGVAQRKMLKDKSGNSETTPLSKANRSRVRQPPAAGGGRVALRPARRAARSAVSVRGPTTPPSAVSPCRCWKRRESCSASARAQDAVHRQPQAQDLVQRLLHPAHIVRAVTADLPQPVRREIPPGRFPFGIAKGSPT